MRQPSLRAAGANQCSSERRKPGFRADPADQDDLAARLEHARELVERAFGVRHRRDHVLRDHDVERVVGKFQMPRVHHREPFDMGEAQFRDPLLRLAQHHLGNVDAEDAIPRRIVGQRNAGADADLQDAAADPLGRGNRGPAAALEHRTEHHVVDRSPPVIRLRDHVSIEFKCFAFAFLTPCQRRLSAAGPAGRLLAASATAARAFRAPPI